MLAVRLCRANGIPVRDRPGPVYAPGPRRQTVLAVPQCGSRPGSTAAGSSFDATLGRGGIGAGHVKITDAPLG